MNVKNTCTCSSGAKIKNISVLFETCGNFDSCVGQICTFSISSSSTTTSHSSDSSHPSSVTEEEFKLLPTNNNNDNNKIPLKYFSLPKFSSVFRKEQKNPTTTPVKCVSSSAKEVIRKCMKKVKPLYKKLSQKQQKVSPVKDKHACVDSSCENRTSNTSHSSSENLKYHFSSRRRRCILSYLSSTGSSPSHSQNGFGSAQMGRVRGSITCCSDTSSRKELQEAIEGAIAHCKNSMVQKNNKDIYV